MTNPVFAHVPFSMLEGNMDFIVTRRINPEIHFPGDSLDAILPEEIAAISAALTAHDIQCTIHTPFVDLNPGSAEPLVREVTRRRFNQVLDAAAILKPRVMVFHPGYDKWRYGDSQDRWLKHAIDTFQMVLERVSTIGCIAAVENIFEEEPSTLRSLLEALDSPFIRHCFDVGHWNVFAKVTMEEWFEEMGCFIAETHIHDNCGSRDDHFPIGNGSIDFPLFFDLMKKYAPGAAYTIEAHCHQDVLTALERLHSFMG